ncbi:unnamed protein product [Fraxinus pennsylvanica]|uniref:Uncharacterized protein n=1 Tax=Fraxinus pennsylvanica TaxID=56036 RepID=A0AAD1Z4C0_9LAMI|nr:unnamed protein product [Fraxinus pennsylvanica]
MTLDDMEEITFGLQNLEGLSRPHNDALVISVIIANFEEKMIPANVLSHEVYSRMGIPVKQLKAIKTLLQGFGGCKIIPEEIVNLPLTLGSNQKQEQEEGPETNRPHRRLNKFLSRTVDRCFPFFKALKENHDFEWNENYERAFQELKQTLATASILTSDSQLVVGQIEGTFERKDEDLSLYCLRVHGLQRRFKSCDIVKISRNENYKVDALTRLAFMGTHGLDKTVHVKFVTKSSISQSPSVMNIEHEPYLMDTIIDFITNENFPDDPPLTRSIRARAPMYEKTNEKGPKWKNMKLR